MNEFTLIVGIMLGLAWISDLIPRRIKHDVGLYAFGICLLVWAYTILQLIFTGRAPEMGAGF